MFTPAVKQQQTIHGSRTERRNVSSIRPLPDNVSRRIIVTNPNLPPLVPRHPATHFFRISPNHLRVMPASRRTTVGVVVIVSLLGNPSLHHLPRSRTPIHNLIKILPKHPISSGSKCSPLNQSISPLLRPGGQPARPSKRRNSRLRPIRIMRRHHLSRSPTLRRRGTAQQKKQQPGME
jgi:hypothetical protein